MQEIIEFRIPAENADRHLPAATGVPLGWVRKVRLPMADPMVTEIGRLQTQFDAEGKAFFHGWTIRRRYSRSELEDASLLHVRPTKSFEPAGEECGTIYDDSVACDHVFARTPAIDIGGRRIGPLVDTCGVGGRQVTSLFIDGRRIPRNVDVARTIAGEIVVSARFVNAFREHGLSGAEFGEVRLSNLGGACSTDHYQLKSVSARVELSSETRAGSGPFDVHAYGRCPRSHLVGLNLLSEIAVKGNDIPKADVLATQQMVGVRRGLLRPHPMLLISPVGWRAMKDAQLAGLVVEVAHVL